MKKNYCVLACAITFAHALAKLYLEDCFGELGAQELVDMALEAKNLTSKSVSDSAILFSFSEQSILFELERRG